MDEGFSFLHKTLLSKLDPIKAFVLYHQMSL